LFFTTEGENREPRVVLEKLGARDHYKSMIYFEKSSAYCSNE